MAYELQGKLSKGLLWLIGATVCLLAADCGFNCTLMRAMDGRIVRCGSCHFRDCKSASGRESVSCKKRYRKLSFYQVASTWPNIDQAYLKPKA